MHDQCWNRIDVRGTREEVEVLLAAIAGPSEDDGAPMFVSLAAVLPTPADADPDAWRLDHWGPTRDLEGEVAIEDLPAAADRRCVRLAFWSDANPVSPWLASLASIYPGPDMDYLYFEPTGHFGGHLSLRDGEVVADEDLGDDDASDLPAFLAHYGIDLDA